MDITAKDPGRGTRWVCPNDRHLALRAKLRIGWSVKTGALDSKWGNYSNSYAAASNRCAQSFVLSEDEQQAIIEVIQRAEALDLSEQERIGRLVERLENMKRNVCIVTGTRMNERRNCSSRCSNSAHCVCSCALCSEKFGAVLGATPNLCKDCRKYICQKCGIETTELNPAFQNTASTKSVLDKTTMQRIVRRSNNSQKQFLCRICAETREMWKKSGAWFIKGMPKYILPEKKERGWSRIGHKQMTWTVGGNKSLELTDPHDSSSDEEVTRLSPFSNSVQSTSSVSKTSPGQRSNDLSSVNNREECSDRLDRSTLSITSQCSRVSPTSSVASPRLRTNGKTSQEPQLEQRVSFEDEIVNEKAKKSNNPNDGNNDTRRIEFNSYNQLKNSQTELVNGSNGTGNDNHSNGTNTRTRSNHRETHGSGRKSILLRKREPAQQQSNRLVAPANVGARGGAKLWNSRNLLAIRPSGSVPPVQSGTSTRLATNGHSWSRRSVLQTEHITGRPSCEYETSPDKDDSQNAESGIQRDSKLLWNDRNRHMEWQNATHSDTPGRSGRPRLSRRS